MYEHDTYKLEVEGQTHTLRAYGSWDYETAQKWHDDTRALIVNIKDAPWACLVDLTEWELAAPDIRSYMYEVNAWINTQNLNYLAVVCRIEVQKEVLKITHVEFTNVDVQYFDDMTEATEWLNSVGF